MSETKKMDASSSPSATRAQRQLLKLRLHPGDEYVASLEPESLQVLVSEFQRGTTTDLTFDLSLPDISQTGQLFS